jgi:exosome complex component RRP4
MKIYLPGDLIKDNVKANKAAIRSENGKTYACVVGTVKDGFFKPFELAYIPSVNDKIIGIVYEKKAKIAFVDTGTAFNGIVQLTNEINIEQGSIIMAKVMKIEDDNNLLLTDVKTLNKENAMLIFIHPSKIARIIGKEGSMLSLIKEKTQCQILIGLNGYIVIYGKNVKNVIKAINFIVERAHLENLTNQVASLLSKGG